MKPPFCGPRRGCRRRPDTALISMGCITGCRRTGMKRARVGRLGLHWVLREKLNRQARKTKGYAKVKEMISGSLPLLWLRQG